MSEHHESGEAVAELIKPRVSAVEAISGILVWKVPANLDRRTIRDERLSKYAPDA